ncbi:ABC transporter permease [Streptomyces sp. RFCAC02]|uniref:ABC transporter permease n=1 Tax=Streptomyces sp. RFCAC02 TaxID=2499143 RepID=UPI001021A01C|nr:ABC transporter permease [Streptomyces sp. RFCAC02]
MSSAIQVGAGVPDPVEAGATPPAEPGLVGRSPGQLMWRRFRRDRTGVISACVVLFFFLIGLLAPVMAKLYGKDPYTRYGQLEPGLLNEYGYPVKPNGGMDGEFWFGLEPGTGRDVLTELLYGIRTSLFVALAVTVLAVLTGIVLGIAAGYLGGRWDFLISRLTDTLMAFPQQLFFVAFLPIITTLFVEPREETPVWVKVLSVITVLWILGWMTLGRILRGVASSLREREFIEAAKVSGASPWRIIRKEMLPNTVSPILVQATYMLPNFVTAAAGLSYLGVGITEPTPDWGRMFATAAEVYRSDITYMFFPGVSLVIFVVAFNLLGDAIRDAFDPRTVR